MKIDRAKTFQLKGRGDVTLREKDHLATGGEGSAYGIVEGGDDLVVKLYTDPNKMDRDRMKEKLPKLAKIRHKFIAGPLGLVHNKGTPVGYYMPWVKGGEFLPRISSNAWQTDHGWGVNETKQLVEGMRQTMIFAHDHNAIMCDPNALNWQMVKGANNMPEPRAFDVDSWQLPGFPGTVVMDNIRDWHAKGFTTESDWYSLGVLAFELFIGVHPYGGILDGYKRNNVDAFLQRMKDNASVFAPGARVPQMARSFGDVPPKMLEWFEATFQHGKREIPPSPFDQAAANTVARVMRVVAAKGSGSLTYDKLFDGVSDPVRRIFPCGIVLRQSGELFDLASRQKVGTAKSYQCELVKKDRHWLMADWDGKKLVFSAIDCQTLAQKELSFGQQAETVVRYENRLFAVTARGLTELSMFSMGKTLILTGDSTWETTLSTRWYDGVGIMDALGASFLVVPHGAAGCSKIRVRELDGLRPVNAKAGDRHVAIVVLNKKGEYRKIELRFDAHYTSYTFMEDGTDRPELNMTFLSGKGLALAVEHDGELLAVVTASGKRVAFVDPEISTKYLLANWGEKAVQLRDGNVWSIKT